MKSVQMFAAIALLLAAVAAPAFAQEKPSVVPIASSKFGLLPVLPACLTLSAQRGDPTKGAAVILIKATAGCKVPWHWHTANENLMFVSGKGKLEMKDEPAHALGAGDYVYMPSKHVHQFTCMAACTFFDAIDGAFDIHYVDKDGKELPVEQALKRAAKPPAKATPKSEKK